MLRIRTTIRLVSGVDDVLPPLATEDCFALPFLEDEEDKQIYPVYEPSKTASPEFYEVLFE